MDLNRFLLFFFFFFFFFLEVPQASLAAYLIAPYLTCMHNITQGTTLSSTFKHNLNKALSNLTFLSSHGTKYAITTTGSGNDIVYAMFQCRGDQTSELCSDCMANATVRLPESDCPNFIGARIQLHGCYLRYDNQSFFTLDTTRVIDYCYAPTSDSVVLATIQSLVENVTTLAPKQGGFASASAGGEYAVAQCLGYLNESECAQCLTTYNYRVICDSTLGEQLHLTSCYYRYEPYSFFEAPSPPPAGQPAVSPLPPGGTAGAPAPPTRSETHKGSNTRIVVGGLTGGAIFAILALCIIFAWRYRVNKTRRLARLDAERVEERGNTWGGSLFQTKAQVFSLQELEEATGHFHPNNRLGEGGFGPVYKGTLSNGEQVAIKKLATTSRQGKQEFLNEVNLITSVQHKNLIRLLGSCAEGPQRLLVYEYLPNKSLDCFLFGEPQNNTKLKWSTRFGVVLGMAKGLAYLHEESHIRIIHRDIKPSNILLDYQLNPIIADFGLARLIQDDLTHINTRVAGTIGYLSPEYALHGELSEKVDVFSFGVVSLEIISGKQSPKNRLLEWVWQLYLQNRVLDMVDPNLGNAFSCEQVIRIVHVALLCTQENSNKRPAMSTVTLWLSGKSEILDFPIKPPFIESSEPREPTFSNNLQWSSTSSPSSTQYAHNSSSRRHQADGGVQSMSEVDAR